MRKPGGQADCGAHNSHARSSDHQCASSERNSDLNHHAIDSDHDPDDDHRVDGDDHPDDNDQDDDDHGRPHHVELVLAVDNRSCRPPLAVPAGDQPGHEDL